MTASVMSKEIGDAIDHLAVLLRVDPTTYCKSVTIQGLTITIEFVKDPTVEEILAKAQLKASDV